MGLVERVHRVRRRGIAQITLVLLLAFLFFTTLLCFQVGRHSLKRQIRKLERLRRLRTRANAALEEARGELSGKGSMRDSFELSSSLKGIESVLGVKDVESSIEGFEFGTLTLLVEISKEGIDYSCVQKRAFVLSPGGLRLSRVISIEEELD